MSEAAHTHPHKASAASHQQAVPPLPELPTASENGEAKLHNDSTSSSNESSPTSALPEIYRSLQVRVWENQRWFPIIGWGTSRLPADPPNLSPFHYQSGVSPNIETLHKQILETNHITLAPTGTQRPQQPILPLEVNLPDGYMWEGYWEVSTAHQRGTDTSGWRYAENFTRALPGGGYKPEHFKKTQTPTCVVRRRTWQRRVRLIRSGPTDSSPTLSDAAGAPVTEDEVAREMYLREKQDEMTLAERLKERRQAVIDGGSEWTQEDELAAEEELRSFTRERRQQFTESATRHLYTNSSFSNPFQISGGDDAVSFGSPDSRQAVGQTESAFAPGRYEGAVAASTWAVDSALNRANADRGNGDLEVSDDEDFVKDMQRRALDGATADVVFEDSSHPTRPDGAQVQAAEGLTFHHHEPSPRTLPADGTVAEEDGPLRQQSTINRFVAASADGDSEENASAASPADGEETNDFNAIFSKFMSNPEA